MTEQIRALGALRAAGRYKGKISIHTVINDSIIGRIFELSQFLENLGADLVLLCFPWYIAEETSREMDTFMYENFDWLCIDSGIRHTWDAFKFSISPLNIPALMQDMTRVNAHIWRTRLRYQPGLEFDEIEPFVRGKAMTARCATRCSVMGARMDVAPTGAASACKFFSEFAVGNLNDATVPEIWNSSTYDKIRTVFERRLSPACSKCNVLYLQEHSMPINI